MILAVCLNPALQCTLIFERLDEGKVNRAKSVRVSVGGKGANVARIARTLGAPVCLFLPLGGERGRLVKRLLREGRIPFRAVPVEGNTRICTTLIDAHHRTHTELVEESEPASRGEVRRMERAFESLLLRARMLILSGTATPGFPETVYGRWIVRAGRLGVPCILDAPVPFAQHGLHAGPWLYRANWAEMEGVLGRTVPANSMESALKTLQDMGAGNVLVSLDGPAAVARIGSRSLRILVPELGVVNPIGSGDAIAAGIGASWVENGDLHMAIRLGMACGAANVLTLLAGTVRKTDVHRLLPRVKTIPP
jgi:tagatose 6-phosphate kinase